MGPQVLRAAKRASGVPIAARISLAGGISLLICSLLMGGAAGVATPSSFGVGTWHAPFHGVGYTPGDSTGVTGCGNAKIVTPTFFSPKNGRGIWDGTAIHT